MLRLVTDPDAPAAVVVSGRTGGIETLRYDRPALPLLRFVGRPLVRYHGAELVTEVDLNVGTDPYLGDHVLDGNMLFPAVLGLEAMTQVATAAAGRADVPVIEDAEFLRPIVVPADGSLPIQIAATVTADDTADVAIRSAETGFAVEHFRARLRFTGAAAPDGPPEQAEGVPPVALDPADLYGSVLFQGARFQRLRRYHRVAARHVDADLAVRPATGWFAGFLPGDLLLGDPGMRDALMHGTQVCVPHATLLPTGVARLFPAASRLAGAGEVRYCAAERSRDGDTYTYDVVVRNGQGEAIERWEGLVLRAVRKGDGAGPWAPELLGPYLERTHEDLTGAQVAVAVIPGNGAGQRPETAAAVASALGRPARVSYRPDGRPEVEGGPAVSASHGAGVTMAVAAAVSATGAVACDLEQVAERPPAAWDGLLGRHGQLARLLAAEAGEDVQTAATRAWAAAECLAKAGLPADAPLSVMPRYANRWVVFASGHLRVTTFVTTMRAPSDPVVFAILSEGR
jgi:enediyne polyketide synthase